MTQHAGNALGLINLILTRGVVPLWVLTGALVKLYERTPANLPSQMLVGARKAGVDFDFLLRFLIGTELLAVGLMLFVPRLSRQVATFMLAAFCSVLVVELIANAKSCGCFGSVKVDPRVMLAIDAGLLIAVVTTWILSRRASETDQNGVSGGWRGAALATLVLGVVGFGVAFGVPPKAAKPQEVAVNDAPAALDSGPSVPTHAATQPEQPGRDVASAPEVPGTPRFRQFSL